MIRKKHIDKLVRLISNNNIKIYFNKNLSLNNSKAVMKCYSIFSYDLKIYIGIKNCNYEKTITAIAHEYGHCISFIYCMYNCSFIGLKFDNCYTTICKGQYKRFLDLKEEKMAWKYGFNVLRQNNIPITKLMKQIKNDYINNQENFYQKTY
jgi:hypothetical protein